MQELKGAIIVKEILFGISAAAIITAVFKALTPSEKFSSQIKLLIACFFVSSAISAVTTGFGFDPKSIISGADSGYNDYSVQIRELTADETADALRTALKEKLSEENIFPEKIYIGVNISESGSISISEIRLVFRNAGEEEKQRAVQLVKSCTDRNTEVTAEDMR